MGIFGTVDCVKMAAICIKEMQDIPVAHELGRFYYHIAVSSLHLSEVAGADL